MAVKKSSFLTNLGFFLLLGGIIYGITPCFHAWMNYPYGVEAMLNPFLSGEGIIAIFLLLLGGVIMYFGLRKKVKK